MDPAKRVIAGVAHLAADRYILAGMARAALTGCMTIVALAIVPMPVVAQTDILATAAKKLSLSVRRAVSMAQSAMAKDELATAKQQVAVAHAAISTPEDRLFTGWLAYQLGTKLKDEALQLAGLDDIIDSGLQSSAPRTQLLMAQAQLAYSVGDDAKAIKAARQLIVIDPAHTNARLVLSNAYARQKQFTASLATLDEAIRLEKEAGHSVPASWTTRYAAILAQAPEGPVTSSSAIAPEPKPSALGAVPATPRAISPRIALVIGNGAYGGGLGNLANPVNDVRAVGAALKAAGFDVVLVENVDQREMRRAIQLFGRRLASAGSGATGLFYYAGHGIQSRGTNYLVPVGANIATEADIEIEAVTADGVLRQMEESGISTSIIVFDACRNLPVARTTRDGVRGLARMDAPNGSFVAYSTAPGSVAQDGVGTNSPFASAFVSELAKRGQPIEIMFRNIRRAVVSSTAGQQTPWDSSSLLESFVFLP